MNDINEIQFEERNVTSAVTWGIISGLYFGIVTFLLKNGFIQSDLIAGLLYLSEVVIIIAITVWVVKIAKKLNRPPVIWGICGFLFPPITLIVIGFQDYKVGDKYIKGIIDELRLDFNTELLHIKSTKDLSKEELTEVEIKLKEKFNQKLKDRISRDGFKKMASDDMTESNIIEEEEKEEEEVVQSVSNQEWTSEKGKCPACGAAISDDATVCPECGLAII
jgi:hypothetical protein